MSRTNDLPFDRGATAYGGDATLISNSDATAYNGIEVQVSDETTGEVIELIALRNSTGSTIAPALGYKPAAGYINKRVNGYPSAGGFGYILDPYYAAKGVTSIANGDVAWFIKEGLCRDAKVGSNWSDGFALAFAANGVLSPCTSTTAGTYVVARANEAATTVDVTGDCYVGTAHGFFASAAVSQSGL